VRLSPGAATSGNSGVSDNSNAPGWSELCCARGRATRSALFLGRGPILASPGSFEGLSSRLMQTRARNSG